MNVDIDHVIFEDESMIRDYQAIGRTWFLKGKHRLIPTYGHHKGVKMIGTLDYATGCIPADIASNPFNSFSLRF
ncbi:transposase [Salimicrobium jeotgali]|uniref:transposase n=1 Tax=Salimicrobium jeotgali TaxID=1230341 RepID=UPI0015E0679C|nr:transposase [Salimicrobium jeotgali]